MLLQLTRSNGLNSYGRKVGATGFAPYCSTAASSRVSGPHGAERGGD